MSEYFAFVVALLRRVTDYSLFEGLLALLFVAAAFRLVWGLCVPSRFSGGRTDTL